MNSTNKRKEWIKDLNNQQRKNFLVKWLSRIGSIFGFLEKHSKILFLGLGAYEAKVIHSQFLDLKNDYQEILKQVDAKYDALEKKINQSESFTNKYIKPWVVNYGTELIKEVSLPTLKNFLWKPKNNKTIALEKETQNKLYQSEQKFHESELLARKALSANSAFEEQNTLLRSIQNDLKSENNRLRLENRNLLENARLARPAIPAKPKNIFSSFFKENWLVKKIMRTTINVSATALETKISRPRSEAEEEYRIERRRKADQQKQRKNLKRNVTSRIEKFRKKAVEGTRKTKQKAVEGTRKAIKENLQQSKKKKSRSKKQPQIVSYFAYGSHHDVRRSQDEATTRYATIVDKPK